MVSHWRFDPRRRWQPLRHHAKRWNRMLRNGVQTKQDWQEDRAVQLRWPPGREPSRSRLVRDAAGNLYGTTVNGGTGTECGGSCGTVFKVDSTGKETVLHSFTGGTDGASPLAGVVLDAQGNLYGTTYYGGTGKCNDEVGVGCGTIFKVDKFGKETVLYNFTGGSDGAGPRDAGLLRDAAGTLYGTATIGGASGDGVVFKLTPW